MYSTTTYSIIPSKLNLLNVVMSPILYFENVVFEFHEGTTKKKQQQQETGLVFECAGKLFIFTTYLSSITTT